MEDHGPCQDLQLLLGQVLLVLAVLDHIPDQEDF